MQSHRHRALLQVKVDLRFGAEHDRRQFLLGRRLVRVLEHGEVEGVAADRDQLVDAEAGKAGIVLARDLSGDLELALGPVAHDLAAGLTGDDEIGGLVPVLNVRLGRHPARVVGGLEDLGDLGTRGGCLILVLIDLEEHVLARDGGDQHVEHARPLPRLAADRQRHLAGLLERRSGGDVFVPGLRNRHAGILERLVGEPQPLPGVDVDRHAVDLAVDGAAVKQADRTDEILPAFLLGQFGEVAHQARLHQFLGLAAMVELGRGHRIAAGDAADENGPRRVAAAGDGAVDPFVAGGVEGLRELGDSGCLAARRPPVGHFKIGRHGDLRY
jgi:hypothetical protein